jgi:hypothetical protein
METCSKANKLININQFLVKQFVDEEKETKTVIILCPSVTICIKE